MGDAQTYRQAMEVEVRSGKLMAQDVLGERMGKRDTLQPQPERVAPWGR